MKPGVLALWMDIDPAVDGEVAEWYIREHVPDRIAVPTYTRARRFKACDGAGHLAVYDATSPEGLADPSYMALLDNISDWGLAMRKAFSNTQRDTFVRLMQAGAGEGAFVTSLRIACDETRRVELGAWLSEACREVATRRHVVSVEVWSQVDVRERMDALRTTGQRDARVQLAVLAESLTLNAADGVLSEVLPAGNLKQRGATAVLKDTYAFQFSMRKP